MKKLQKGFTLVELIVVITILAILGTIAFISLQGYSQDARNSKVSSDVRSLASAIEVKVTEGTSVHSLVVPVAANDATVSTYGSGVALSTSSKQSAGDINFIALGQNDSDFGANTYKIGALTNTNATTGDADVMYQIVGAYGPSDAYTADVKGNYIFVDGTDTRGLVSATDSTDGLAQDDVISTDASDGTPNL